MTLYTVAGYSRGPDGKVKFRVANSISRAGVLARNGHSEVALRVLPIAMSKEAAEAFLASNGARKELGGQKPSEPVMSAQQAQVIRAEFNSRLRAVWEAN
jgi:hypothetical protein